MRKDFAVMFGGSKHRRGSYAARIKLSAQKIGIIIGGLVLCFIVIPFLSITWIVRDLPTPNKIVQDARYSSTILDKNDKVVYQIFQNKNITPVSLSILPVYVSQATIAIEDKSFFQHGGFSIAGIIRALIRDFIFHTGEGGSTLTQQPI